MKDTFLIPAKVVKELVRFKLIKYRIIGSMIHFKTKDKVIVSGILHTGEYYETSKHFEFKGETVRFPKEMREAMNTISVMVEAEELSGEPQYVDVVIDKKLITCVSSKDVGEVIAEFKCKSKVDKRKSFKIKPEVLEKILEHSRKVKIGKSKVVFELENFRHLAALVK
jgi:hypothetical protein